MIFGQLGNDVLLGDGALSDGRRAPGATSAASIRSARWC